MFFELFWRSAKFVGKDKLIVLRIIIEPKIVKGCKWQTDIV